jgi:GxxExxY protein
MLGAKFGEPTAEHNRLSREIVDSAFKVHSALGPGLLESVYERCLAYELDLRKIRVDRQVMVPVIYRDMKLGAGFRIDLVAGGLVAVEIKAVEQMMAVHEAQLLTYLKLSGIGMGLLINFNVPLIKNGIRRLINVAR